MLDPPGQDVPKWVTAWIFIQCDVPDEKGGVRLNCKNESYSKALKMRAAISFHYNENGRGSNHWHEQNDGTLAGNPWLSYTVSRYMISLQRRKVSTHFLNCLFA
jgi:hypothetical protein